MTSQHIQQLQALFRVGQENPITLRAIGGGPVENLTFCAREYPALEDRWAAFAADADRLNSARYNIYTCLNPIKPEFAGKAGEAVTDADISCRRLFLIDLDRAGSAKAEEKRHSRKAPKAAPRRTCLPRPCSPEAPRWCKRA